MWLSFKRIISNTSFILLFLLIVTAWPKSFRLSVAVLPADYARPEVYTLYQNKAEEAIQFLTMQPNIHLIPQDSLQMLLGEPLTPLFADEFDPFSLAAVNKHLDLDVVVFCSLNLQEGAAYLQLDAFEFPAGIAGQRVQIRLSDSPEWKWDKIFTRSCKPLLQFLEKSDDLLGQPFPEDVRGLIVLTEDVNDSLYLQNCREILDRLPADESKKPLRFKVWEKMAIFPHQRVYPEGLHLIERTRAEYLLYLSQGAQVTLSWVVPADSIFQQPVCEWHLPMLPAIPQLTQIEAVPDSVLLQLLGYVYLFPPQRSQTLRMAMDLLRERPQEDGIAAAALTACIRHHQQLTADEINDQHPDVPWLLRGYEMIASTAANKAIQAWSDIHLGSLLMELNQPEEALLSFKRADSLFLQLRDRRGSNLARIGLAKVLSAEERWQEAFTVYDHAGRTPADSITLAFMLREMALILERQDKTEEAIRMYLSGSHLNDRLQRPYEAALAYDRISELLRSKGQLYRALAYADTFLMRAQQLNHEPAIARGHFQVALTKLKLQHIDDALAEFKVTLDHMETLGDARGMARTDLNIGAIYWQKGDTLEARRHYFAALQQASRAEDSTAVLLSCMNLGEWYAASKDWPRAQYYYDRGLAIAQKYGNIEEMAKITYAKGLALLDEGRLRMAYDQFQQALWIGKGAATGDPQKEELFLRKLQAIIGERESTAKTDSNIKQLLSR